MDESDYSYSKLTSTKNRIREGAGQYGISATRYDFLRIAKAIMDDWQNETCEGKYLKEIYDRRVRNHKKSISWNSLQDNGDIMHSWIPQQNMVDNFGQILMGCGIKIYL